MNLYVRPHGTTYSRPKTQGGCDRWWHAGRLLFSETSFHNEVHSNQWVRKTNSLNCIRMIFRFYFKNTTVCSCVWVQKAQRLKHPNIKLCFMFHIWNPCVRRTSVPAVQYERGHWSVNALCWHKPACCPRGAPVLLTSRPETDQLCPALSASDWSEVTRTGSGCRHPVLMLCLSCTPQHYRMCLQQTSHPGYLTWHLILLDWLETYLKRSCLCVQATPNMKEDTDVTTNPSF